MTKFPKYFNSPIELTWEITHYCNLNCIHCYNDSGKKINDQELNEKEKISIAKQITKLKVMGVCISGGEPILCKSFWKLASFFKGKLFLSTITNGFFINEYTAPRYVDMFGMIQVSIDGSKPDIHDKIRGKKSSWERAYKGMHLLRDFGGKFSVATTVISHNISDIGNIIDMAYKIGACMWRGEVVIKSGRAARNYENIKPSREQILFLNRLLKQKKREYGESFLLFFARDSLSLIKKSLRKSSIPIWHCYISPSGDCKFLPFFSYPSVSLKQHTLSEAWKKIRNLHKDPHFFEIISDLPDRSLSEMFSEVGKNE